MKTMLVGGFLMLVTSAFAHNAELNVISNEQMVAEYFARYTFPTNDVDLSFDLDFRPQRADVIYLIQRDFILASTNSFFVIADFVNQGHFMSTSNRVEDIRLAHAHDNFLEFGTSNAVRRSGLIYHGPTARARIRKYNLRFSHNLSLKNFRRGVLRDVRYELGRPRWSFLPMEDRTNLWEAVKRRMNATAEEVQGIETLEILNP